jgi:hypothetical protein
MAQPHPQSEGKAHCDLERHGLQVRLHAMHLGNILPIAHKRLCKNLDGVLQGQRVYVHGV